MQSKPIIAQRREKDNSPFRRCAKNFFRALGYSTGRSKIRSISLAPPLLVKQVGI